MSEDRATALLSGMKLSSRELTFSHSSSLIVDFEKRLEKLSNARNLMPSLIELHKALNLSLLLILYKGNSSKYIFSYEA